VLIETNVGLITYRIEAVEAPVAVVDEDSAHHTVAARRSIRAAAGRSRRASTCPKVIVMPRHDGISVKVLVFFRVVEAREKNPPLLAGKRLAELGCPRRWLKVWYVGAPGFRPDAIAVFPNFEREGLVAHLRLGVEELEDVLWHVAEKQYGENPRILAEFIGCAADTNPSITLSIVVAPGLLRGEG
jgi:hypothetical protein